MRVGPPTVSGGTWPGRAKASEPASERQAGFMFGGTDRFGTLITWYAMVMPLRRAYSSLSKYFDMWRGGLMTQGIATVHRD